MVEQFKQVADRPEVKKNACFISLFVWKTYVLFS
jgi:hypothetical protein